MRVQTRQPTKIPSQLHPLAEVLARRDFRRNSDNAFAEIDKISLVGDCVVEFDVLSINAEAAYMILGNSSGHTNCIFITGNDISVRDAAGFTVSSIGDNVLSGLMHHIKVEKVGTSVSIYIDGVPRGVGISNDPYNFNMLYTRQDATNFTLRGMLANLKAWDNSNGSELVVDMPLTKYLPNPNIIENKAKPLGAEVWHYADAVDYDLGGAYRLISGTHGGSPVEAGTTYLVSAYLETDGSTYFEMGDTTGPARASFPATTGWVTFIVKTPSPLTSTCMRWSTSGSGPFTGSITNVSIRKAEGWGQYINPLESDWGVGPFELQWNGDWLGSDSVGLISFVTQQVGAPISINATTVSGVSGEQARIWFPIGTFEIEQDWELTIESSGLAYIDLCDGEANRSAGLTRIVTSRPSDKTAEETYRFIDVVFSDPCTVKIISVKKVLKSA